MRTSKHARTHARTHTHTHTRGATNLQRLLVTSTCPGRRWRAHTCGGSPSADAYMAREAHRGIWHLRPLHRTSSGCLCCRHRRVRQRSGAPKTAAFLHPPLSHRRRPLPALSAATPLAPRVQSADAAGGQKGERTEETGGEACTASSSRNSAPSTTSEPLPAISPMPPISTALP